MSDPERGERGGPRRIGGRAVNLDSVAWGLVGGLSFLVLLTGYELATGFRATWLVKFGVALLVTAVAAVASALIERQMRGRRQENERA